LKQLRIFDAAPISVVGIDVDIGPYKTPANPYCLTTFERKADLPQQFKRSDLQIWCTVTGGAYHSARKVSMCVRKD